jgi:hypothetical protein
MVAKTRTDFEDDVLIAAIIYRRCSAKESTLMKDFQGLYVYHPARSATIARLDRPVGATRHLSSPGASEVFCVPIRTCVDPTCFLHERLQLRRRHLALGDIPQCPRPFADRFDVDIIITRAANDGSKWVRIPVEGQLRKFECVSQKFLRFSPYFEMFDNSEHGFQISVDGIACPAGLKYVPRMSELFKPSPKAIFRCLIFRGAMWWPQSFGDRRGPSQQ